MKKLLLSVAVVALAITGTSAQKRVKKTDTQSVPVPQQQLTTPVPQDALQQNTEVAQPVTSPADPNNNGTLQNGQPVPNGVQQPVGTPQPATGTTMPTQQR